MDEVQGVKGRIHQNIDESRIPLVRAFRISSQRPVGDGWAYIDSHRFIMCTISCAAIALLCSIGSLCLDCRSLRPHGGRSPTDSKIIHDSGGIPAFEIISLYSISTDSPSSSSSERPRP